MPHLWGRKRRGERTCVNFAGGWALFPGWRRGPSIPPDVSRFFAWLSPGQVVDDSVMVCGLFSGVVPGSYRLRIFHRYWCLLE